MFGSPLYQLQIPGKFYAFKAGRLVVLRNSHQSFVGCFNVSRLTCSTHLLGNSPLMKLNHLPEKQTGEKAWFHLVEI